MNLPEIYLSSPGVRLPVTTWDNEEVLARVASCYRGDPQAWRKIERAIRYVFRSCGSAVRHVELERPRPVADHAVGAAEAVIERHAPERIDAVVYAGIARDYYEPATAAEVAAKLGIVDVPTWDVIGACAGPLVALSAVAGSMAIDPNLDTVLITAAAMSGPHLSYDIQSLEDLDTLAAGLTIGNASAAFLVSRRPFASGGRLRGILVEGRPQHHALCRVPTSGFFRSAGAAMFALAAEVPGHMRRAAARAGWAVDAVDLWASHQPSNTILRDVANALDIEPERLPQLHQLFGNTESCAVPVALDHLLASGRIRPGMKLGLGSAAAGFTLATAMVEWGPLPEAAAARQ